jgi:RNA polymerase sigma-70 factor (ECF subfamily)
MDAGPLALLLARERSRFLELARRRLPHGADAEDVVQSAMMRAAERAGSLEDPARLHPWFGRILRRAIADFYRAKGPETPSGSAGLEVAVAAPEPSGNPCACSVRLMRGLPSAYSDVLRLVDLEGLGAAAAASALGITPANLHVRLHRARRALRARVMRHCGVTGCGPCLDCKCDAGHRCGGMAEAAS